MAMANEFYAEVRGRNKAKFIAITSKKIDEFNKQNDPNGVNLPSFIEAEQAYKNFEQAGCFDEYGRLKEVPNA